MLMKRAGGTLGACDVLNLWSSRCLDSPVGAIGCVATTNYKLVKDQEVACPLVTYTSWYVAFQILVFGLHLQIGLGNSLDIGGYARF
jgi:hypothetical protein